MNIEPDPQEPVTTLAIILEGWATIQKRQAAAHLEKMEALRV